MAYKVLAPNITGVTEKEQLEATKRYLFALSQQLEWALNSLEAPSSHSTHVAQQTPKTVVAQAKEEDAETAFNHLKPLIIKSAEIVEAYYDEINTRLQGMYVASSDFGTYIEETDLKISANSSDISQYYENMQEIITGIDNLNLALAETNGYIKTGEIDRDDNGYPVYGVEIRQRKFADGEEIFDKCARFTSDRLSFYDKNDTEVAYISDYKLYINNVEIKVSMKIGGLVDMVTETGDVVTKWVGKE